jgi:WhiB family redox-sensing transcriptional regulator
VKARSALTYSPGAFGPVLADLSGDPLGWQTFALCTEIDTELFFPRAGGVSNAVKAICDDCPVRAECLDYALDYERALGDLAHIFGTFGGLSARSRARILAAEGQQLGAAA